jgi:hypothetical protein
MSVLVAAERQLLARVLDRLVPPEAGFPGAGDLGIGAFVEEALGRSPASRRVFLEGLRAIAGEAHARGGGDFAALAGAEQDAVLHAIQSARPEFFDALLVHAYSGYYSAPEIIRLLGIEVRPPQPHGHAIEPFDPGLLARVRARPPLYRPAP